METPAADHRHRRVMSGQRRAAPAQETMGPPFEVPTLLMAPVSWVQRVSDAVLPPPQALGTAAPAGDQLHLLDQTARTATHFRYPYHLRTESLALCPSCRAALEAMFRDFPLVE
jgi:hypothetical protein